MRLLVLCFYNLLLLPALVLALPSAVRKARRRGGAKQNFLQRFSFYSPETRKRFTTPTDIWIHAVSVGEVLIARRLILAILAESPESKIALSTTTPTGYSVANEKLPPGIPVIYSPLDLPGVVHRSLALVRPRQVALVEAEIWPNFLSAAHYSGIPVSLVNARLSPRSARRFTKFRALVAPVYSLLEFVGVQESGDASTWRNLGVDPENIHHTGSLKFDPSANPETDVPPEIRARLEPVWQFPVTMVLAASTHPGEELLIANAVRSLQEKHPDLRLLACPRHVERTPELIGELGSAGFTVQRRSDVASSGDPDVFIIDTTGELNAWTSLADIVVVGKSFLATGGQNPAEAIAARKPTVTGPHMENFAALVKELREAEGIIQVGSVTELPDAIDEAMEDGKAIASRGHAILESHRGACSRTARFLLDSTT